MKLRVRQTGVVEKELDVFIKNPSATIANVRAAIAILFKLSPGTFRMVREGGSTINDAEQREQQADEWSDRTLLSATGLKDGDRIVLLTAKRERTEEYVDDVPSALPSSSPSSVTVVTTPAVPSPVNTASSATSATASTTVAVVAPTATAQSSNTDRPTVPAKRLRGTAAASNRSTTEARSTAPHRISESDDAFLAERLAADANENNEDDEDGEFDDDFDDGADEEDGEEDEVQEMVSHLLSVPNILEMRQQFLLNPSAVLSEIQTSNPRLFQLISAHNQEFLDLVQNETLLEALQMERDAEDDEEGDEDGFFLGEEDEEGEYDEESEAMMHELILNALNAANLPADDDIEDEDDDNANRGGADSAATSVTLGRNATQHLNSLRSTGAASGGRGGGSTSNASATSRQRGSVPVVISEEDQSKIDELMNLGFTKEQCTAAFFACSRSIERAANMLFENPPSL